MDSNKNQTCGGGLGPRRLSPNAVVSKFGVPFPPHATSIMLKPSESDLSLQLQSLFFRKLPQELRFQVLEYILSEASNGIVGHDMSLSWTRLYPRPDLNILMTCRRAYYEASLVMENCVTYYILCNVVEFGFLPEHRAARWPLQILEYQLGHPNVPADAQFNSLTSSVKDPACISRVVLSGVGTNAAQFRILCSLPLFQPKHLTVRRSFNRSTMVMADQTSTQNVLRHEQNIGGWFPEWSPVPNSVQTITFTSFLYNRVRSKNEVLEVDPKDVARAEHMKLSLTNYAGESLTPKGKEAITFGECFHVDRNRVESGRPPLWRVCRIRVSFTR